MGQTFTACIYDIDNMECCTVEADKFHANCYSYCGTVLSTHYLLRRKAYNVMWGGDDVLIDDNIATFDKHKDLLGLSTYIRYSDITFNNRNLKRKPWHDKAIFIRDNYKLWKRINVIDRAINHFNWHKARVLPYTGYLLNHTQSLAIDLDDYYLKSWSIKYSVGFYIGAYVVDPVPVLTETGGGSAMLFFEGMSADTTAMLAGKWCGDLLQITATIPKSYKIINCVFSNRL
jgi:hypothetical protein